MDVFEFAPQVQFKFKLKFVFSGWGVNGYDLLPMVCTIYFRRIISSLADVMLLVFFSFCCSVFFDDVTRTEKKMEWVAVIDSL